ncbi:MAG TPA: hypothetical protein VFP42_12340 [Acidimicrobiia bacterium]|nr:hypothetical protein [Acidimicrobiia bacterium]
MAGRILGESGAHIDAATSARYLRPLSTLRRIAYLVGMVAVAALLTLGGVHALNIAMSWL